MNNELEVLKEHWLFLKLLLPYVKMENNLPTLKGSRTYLFLPVLFRHRMHLMLIILSRNQRFV